MIIVGNYITIFTQWQLFQLLRAQLQSIFKLVYLIFPDKIIRERGREKMGLIIIYFVCYTMSQNKLFFFLLSIIYNILFLGNRVARWERERLCTMLKVPVRIPAVTDNYSVSSSGHRSRDLETLLGHTQIKKKNLAGERDLCPTSTLETIYGYYNTFFFIISFLKDNFLSLCHIFNSSSYSII